MKPINDNNIDEILFQLLEGEITGKEREQLLEAIEADEAYHKLWMTWQQTVLKPEQDDVYFNVAPLKKKTARIIPLNFKYAAAAAVVLSVGVAMFINSNQKTDNSLADIKPAGKKPVIQTPALPQNSVKSAPYQTVQDTVIPLKEKIRFIARKNSDAHELPAPEIKMPEMLASEPVKNTPVSSWEIPVRLVQENTPAASTPETILVSIENEIAVKPEVEKPSLFSRITGGSRIKIENDSTTRTSKRIIIENKKYQIIAGF